MLEFDWDDANLAHIARHGVSRDEAEQAVCCETLFIHEYDVDDEVRLEEIGQTLAGRILKIVTTDRHDKLRVVTSFDASPYEKSLYLRSRIV